MDKSNAPKEITVKSANTILRVGAMIPTLLLIACQGQSAFKRETNPVKDYSRAITDSRAYRPGIKREVNQPADNTQSYCGPQFAVDVQGDLGNKLLTFHEGSETAYEINVRPLSNEKYTVEATLPKGAELRPIKDGLTYQLVWKPGVSRARVSALKLRFNSPALEKKCDVASFSESINLVVNPDAGAPMLSVSAPPQTAITFGDSFKFKISIVDPAATPDKPPTWTSISSDLKSIGNAESRSIGAKDAVDCQKVGKAVSDTTYEFDCAFNSSLIANPPVDSGLTLNAVFFVKGKSQRTERSTAEQDGFATSVQVTFPKKKVDESPLRRDPEHGIEIAKTPAPETTAAATPATTASEAVTLKLAPRATPLPPRRPKGL